MFDESIGGSEDDLLAPAEVVVNNDLVIIT